MGIYILKDLVEGYHVPSIAGKCSVEKPPPSYRDFHCAGNIVVLFSGAFNPTIPESKHTKSSNKTFKFFQKISKHLTNCNTECMQEYISRKKSRMFRMPSQIRVLVLNIDNLYLPPCESDHHFSSCDFTCSSNQVLQNFLISIY